MTREEAERQVRFQFLSYPGRAEEILAALATPEGGLRVGQRVESVSPKWPGHGTITGYVVTWDTGLVGPYEPDLLLPLAEEGRG